MKNAKTGTWWSRDTAGHGGSAWKVYKEKPGGALEWMADADAQGNFISGKHKSAIGTLVKKNEMITTAEEFVSLRESSVQEEYLRAARDSAPIAVWHDVIARFPHMRRWVAMNKTLPVEILEVLAKDTDPDVRVFVAMKNSLPLHLMVLLSRDQAASVRERIAYNKRTPISILMDLCSDPCDLVSAAALERMRGKAGEAE